MDSDYASEVYSPHVNDVEDSNPILSLEELPDDLGKLSIPESQIILKEIILTTQFFFYFQMLVNSSHILYPILT